MPHPPARRERAALCDQLDRAGAGAPTLCAGWTTYDLVAHLVLRERRYDAAAGLTIKPLAAYTASVQERLKARHPYPKLVDVYRRPGGMYALFPVLDRAVNTVELFVHHEDVRRARPGWEPRELAPDLEERLWRSVAAGARLLLRASPVGVVLHRRGGGSGGRRVALGGARKGPRVEVAGGAAELLLFCFGRQEHADVRLTGDAGAIARLREAGLGL